MVSRARVSDPRRWREARREVGLCPPRPEPQIHLKPLGWVMMHLDTSLSWDFWLPEIICVGFIPLLQQTGAPQERCCAELCRVENVRFRVLRCSHNHLKCLNIQFPSRNCMLLAAFETRERTPRGTVCFLGVVSSSAKDLSSNCTICALGRCDCIPCFANFFPLFLFFFPPALERSSAIAGPNIPPSPGLGCSEPPATRLPLLGWFSGKYITGTKAAPNGAWDPVAPTVPPAPRAHPWVAIPPPPCHSRTDPQTHRNAPQKARPRCCQAAGPKRGQKPQIWGEELMPDASRTHVCSQGARHVIVI